MIVRSHRRRVHAANPAEVILHANLEVACFRLVLPSLRYPRRTQNHIAQETSLVYACVWRSGPLSSYRRNQPYRPV